MHLPVGRHGLLTIAGGSVAVGLLFGVFATNSGGGAAGSIALVAAALGGRQALSSLATATIVGRKQLGDRYALIFTANTFVGLALAAILQAILAAVDASTSGVILTGAVGYLVLGAGALASTAL